MQIYINNVISEQLKEDYLNENKHKKAMVKILEKSKSKLKSIDKITKAHQNELLDKLSKFCI